MQAFFGLISTARPVRPLCLIFFASILIILAAIARIISSPPKIKLSPMLISQSQWTLSTSTDSPSSKSRYFHGCVCFAHTHLYLILKYDRRQECSRGKRRHDFTEHLNMTYRVDVPLILITPMTIPSVSSKNMPTNKSASPLST